MEESFYQRNIFGVWISIAIVLCITGIVVLNHDISIEKQENIRSKINILNDISDCVWFKTTLQDYNNLWIDRPDQKIIDTMEKRIKELKC